MTTQTIAPVEVGRAYGVTLGEAAKVVVKVVGASLGTVAQDFEKADVVGSAESFERKVSKYEYEYMVVGAATLTFKDKVASVAADLYDDTGAKIGEEPLAGAVGVGQSLVIAAPETAAYRIVRVSIQLPGTKIFLR